MKAYDVWAPRAERVRLFTGGQTYPMHSSPNGWWTFAGDDEERGRLSPSDKYGYLLDDDTRPVPDPRSRRQPDDVDGLSLLFDPAAHAWADDGWTGRQLAGGMIYELHVGTFTPDGTLDAAIGSQNHDQIGNRAAGDRLSATLEAGQLAIAAVLTMTTPFTPMLFMGEEWGASTPWQFFTAHMQPDLAEATVEGRIKEFERMGWDPAAVPNPQDDNTFAQSKLDWNEIEQPAHAQLLTLYRELALLRRQTPDLTNPRFTETSVDFDEDAGWFVMTRGSTVVAVNFANVPSVVPAVGTMILATDPAVVVRHDHAELPPHSAVVLAI